MKFILTKNFSISKRKMEDDKIVQDITLDERTFLLKLGFKYNSNLKEYTKVKCKEIDTLDYFMQNMI